MTKLESIETSRLLKLIWQNLPFIVTRAWNYNVCTLDILVHSEQNIGTPPLSKENRKEEVKKMITLSECKSCEIVRRRMWSKVKNNSNGN